MKNKALMLGIFILCTLLLLAYATVRINEGSFFPGSRYHLLVEIESASGIDNKTSVVMAGVPIGQVSKISLVGPNRAELDLEIDKGVIVTSATEVRVKTTGFLGDTYIELYQLNNAGLVLKAGDRLTHVTPGGDLTGQLSDIASDVKAITGTLKTLMAGDDSSFAKSLRNVEQITNSLKNVTTGNEANLNAIIANLKDVSINLNRMVAHNEGNVNATLNNVASITDKMKNGEGTIGRLLNDESTVDKINESLDGINNIVGGTGRLQVGIGYHSEYLGASQEFKQYVGLQVQPRPDKYFSFEFVDDPAPPASTTITKTKITSGGKTSSVTEESNVQDLNKFRFSAQFAKKFYALTFRGGMIESTGGAGLDFNQGPLGLQFSAFDFKVKRTAPPHLKLMSTFNLTQSIYLLGGLDDFVNDDQDLDWFLGAGLRFTDDDVKSLFGLASLKP